MDRVEDKKEVRAIRVLHQLIYRQTKNAVIAMMEVKTAAMSPTDVRRKTVRISDAEHLDHWRKRHMPELDHKNKDCEGADAVLPKGWLTVQRTGVIEAGRAFAEGAACRVAIAVTGAKNPGGKTESGSPIGMEEEIYRCSDIHRHLHAYLQTGQNKMYELRADKNAGCAALFRRKLYPAVFRVRVCLHR